MTNTLFTRVNILDGSGDLPFLGEVLVRGNRIVSVHRGLPTQPPDNVQIIDGMGTATLMPGLIESHAHLSIDNTDDLAKIGNIPPEETTLIAARNASLYLDFGITSCISAAAAKPRIDVVIRNAINAGQIPGPRLLAASPWLTVTGGLGDLRTMHMPHVGSMAIVLDGPEAFRRQVRELIREGVDIIKLVISGAGPFPAEIRSCQQTEHLAVPVGIEHVFGIHVAVLALADQAITEVRPYVQRVITVETGKL